MRCCAPSISMSFHVTWTSRLRDETPRVPEVKHHMHQCQECEEAYLALLELVGKENSSGPSR
jgi:hypothetical protein